MARNANTFSLGGPGGILYMTPAEARRLVSAAMQQFKNIQTNGRGLSATEVSLVEKIETFRKRHPAGGL